MIDLLNWGLRTGVVISGLIGLVLLLRRPFARYFGAEATFLLWSLPLIRLCLPDMYVSSHAGGTLLPFELPYDKFPMWGSSKTSVSMDIAVSPSLAEPLTQSPFVLPPDVFIAAIVFLWLIGGVLWLSFYGVQHVRYGRLLRHVSIDYPSSLEHNIARAAHLIGLKKLPIIKVAPKNIGPLVSGVFNPIVILPKGFDKDYSRDAQVLSLAHEFSHMKRRDLWSTFAVLVFRALHWYNPLVHYAARKFRADLEAACDTYTLSKFAGNNSAAHDYAHTLLLAEQNGLASSKMPALSLALHENYEGEVS